jgi:hypothetical protein
LLLILNNHYVIIINICKQPNLIGVSKTSHTTHDTKDIVVGGVDTDLGGLGTRDGSSRDNKLKSSVVNSGEIASSRWLVLLGAKGEGVAVNTSVGVSGVVLERLNEVEVSTFALGEAILTVKLELSGDNRVLTPAVHLEGSLSEDESTGIRDTVVGTCWECFIGTLGIISTINLDGGVSSGCGSSCSGVSEKTRSINDRVVGGVIGELCSGRECADGVRKSIDGISVVERLCTKSGVENLTTLERVTVADVDIRLDNPDKLLAWVVEIEFNLVTGRSNGLITSELKLLNEVLVGVLGHASTLIGIEENVVNIERSSNERFAVGISSFLVTGSTVNILYTPEALVHGSKLNVDLDLVVLKSNKGKSETGVAAEPKLKRNVESSLGKSLARSADGIRDIGAGASGSDSSESWVGKVGKLCGVTNHLVETILLLTGEGKLVPDVHPVSVLSVDALTTNLDLNHRDELVSGIIKPSSVLSISLVNLGKSNLKVCSVS